jgi:hypothetical protein
MNKNQIKEILETEEDLDKIADKILALDKSKLPTSDGSGPKLDKSNDEYEILSFTHIISQNVYSLELGGYRNGGSKLFSLSCMLHEQDCVDNGAFVISSVKRLSDGTIFTLGDRIDLYNHLYPHDGLNKQHTITKFELINNQIRLHFGCNKCTVLLKNAVKLVTIFNPIPKAKTPLFKTEDGVDVCDGDTYYYTNINNFVIHKVIAIKGRMSGRKATNVLDFSTKQVALDYVILNKPCLSVKEVLNLNMSTEGLFTKSLKQLVKSKL